MTAERLPLAGVTILDFTTAWAGPMATRSLAFFGARVIKIEGPTKLDSWRGAHRRGDVERFPDLDPGERPYDRNAWFNTQNHDKLSVGVNLRKPGAKDLVLAIGQHADVVIANFSPGTMSRLGLGYADFARLRPDIIMIEMPALGNDGPASHHVGMGQTMESATGMTALMGYGDGDPTLSGTAYLDPIGGLHGAAATLAALEYRRRTGRGQYVEVPQVEAAMHWIGEHLAAADAADPPDVPRGNHRHGEAVHCAVPAAGDDEWLAVSCTTDEEWRGLCAALGRRDWEQDADLVTLPGRIARAKEIEAGIADWAIHVDKHVAAAALQQRGVRAAPVNTGRDLAQDPDMWSRGFYGRLQHPLAGEHWYPGLPYRLETTPGSMRDPAPCFGQQTREVLADLVGLGDEEIDALFAAGVVASDPVLE